MENTLNELIAEYGNLIAIEKILNNSNFDIIFKAEITVIDNGLLSTSEKRTLVTSEVKNRIAENTKNEIKQRKQEIEKEFVSRWYGKGEQYMKNNTETVRKGPTPEEIYTAIIMSLKYINKGHEFLITGINGPTGKSWLCKKLNESGYIAYDLTDVSDIKRVEQEYKRSKQYKHNYFDENNNTIYLVERLDLNKIRKGE